MSSFKHKRHSSSINESREGKKRTLTHSMSLLKLYNTNLRGNDETILDNPKHTSQILKASNDKRSIERNELIFLGKSSSRQMPLLHPNKDPTMLTVNEPPNLTSANNMPTCVSNNNILETAKDVVISKDYLRSCYIEEMYESANIDVDYAASLERTLLKNIQEKKNNLNVLANYKSLNLMYNKKLSEYKNTKELMLSPNMNKYRENTRDICRTNRPSMVNSVEFLTSEVGTSSSYIFAQNKSQKSLLESQEHDTKKRLKENHILSQKRIESTGFHAKPKKENIELNKYIDLSRDIESFIEKDKYYSRNYKHLNANTRNLDNLRSSNETKFSTQQSRFLNMKNNPLLQSKEQSTLSDEILKEHFTIFEKREKRLRSEDKFDKFDSKVIKDHEKLFSEESSGKKHLEQVFTKIPKIFSFNKLGTERKTNKQDEEEEKFIAKFNKTNSVGINSFLSRGHKAFEDLESKSLQAQSNLSKKGQYVNTKIIEITSNYSKSKFISNKLGHRNVFVMVAGSSIVSLNMHLPGKFLEIQTKELLKKCKSKRECLNYFYNFLNLCCEAFSKKFTSVFLLDGTPIFDLIDVPDSERILVVSITVVYKEIYLINKKKDDDLIFSHSRKENVMFYFKNRDYLEERERKKVLMKSKVNNLPATKLSILKSKVNLPKRIKNHTQTFVYEDTCTVNDEILFPYGSDDEETKSRIRIELNPKDRLTKITEFIDFSILFKRRVNESKKLKQSDKAKTKLNRIEIIDKYNAKRKLEETKARNYRIRKNEPRFPQNFSKLKPNAKEYNPDDYFFKFEQIATKIFNEMKLFKTTSISSDYETLSMKILSPVQKNKELTFVKNNIKQHENFFTKIDLLVEKVYPDLIQLNVPRLISKFKNLTRNDVYELFIQYKSLLKLCIALNKDLKLVHYGIDSHTFHKGVPEMSTEDRTLAEKIFATLNLRKNGYLSLEEFLNGMLTIKSENFSEKLDIFFKIIDSDGNGKLSYKEVLNISKDSLRRTIKGEESTEIINEIAEFFAKLIFSVVGMTKEEQIDLPKIKEEIMNGGKEAGYLEMFCCADNFKNNVKINL